MRIIVTQQNNEELIINLLKAYQTNEEWGVGNDYNLYSKMFYEYILNTTMISQKLRNILKFHFCKNYDKTYDLLIYQSNISNNFYDLLTSLLIEIEYIDFYQNFVSFYGYDFNTNEKFDIDRNFQTDASRNPYKKLDKYKNVFKNKRSKIVKFFNIEIDKIIRRIEGYEYNNFNEDIEKERNGMYKKILDLLYDNKILSNMNMNNTDNSLQNSIVKFVKNLKIQKYDYNIEEIYSFFQNNLFEYQVINTEQGYKETEELEKLNMIEKSLDHIILDTEDSENNILTTRILNTDNTHNEYLLKLKIFKFLKDFKNKRIKKHKIKSTLGHKEEIARVFYENLLKSRLFYGLCKWVKTISFYNIIKDNYLEYKLAYLSKYLVKLLIYVYNRKKMISAYADIRDKRNTKKIFNLFASKTKFKITHNKIYFSQLLNNTYSARFLLMLYDTVNKLGMNIKTMSIYPYNIQSVIYQNEYNKKRKIFSLFKENIRIQKEYNKSLEDIAVNFQNIYIQNEILLFYKNMKMKIIQKKMIKKFKTNIFLIRYYYNRYKRENKQQKIDNLRRHFITFRMRNIINNVFRKKKNNNNNKGVVDPRKTVKEINHYYRDRLIKKIFNELRIYSDLSSKIRYITGKRIYTMKNEMFRRLRILYIESLVKQGVTHKVNVYYKKLFLTLLFLTSVNKLKVARSRESRMIRIKKGLFRQMQKKKMKDVSLLKKYMKFYYNIFRYKIGYMKNKNKGEELIDSSIASKERLFFYSIFIQKIRLKKNKTLTLDNTLEASNKIFYYTLYLNKIRMNLYRKWEVKKKVRHIHFKYLLKNINIQMTDNAYKQISKKIKLVQTLKKFLKNVYKLIDHKFLKEKMDRLVKEYYHEKILSDLKYGAKNKNIINQITMYHNLKIKRKILQNMKHQYTNSLKYKLLSQRYNDYLIISLLKNLTIIIIQKKNK